MIPQTHSDRSIRNPLNEIFSKFEKANGPVVVGIDEAGRGPVMGPMVYGMYIGMEEKCKKAIKINLEDDIHSTGNEMPCKKVKPMVGSYIVAYKDSKQLTEKQRGFLFEHIKKCKHDVCGYAYVKVHPVFITSHMEDDLNLNEVARLAVVHLVELAVANYGNISKIYIDGLGNNEKYREALEGLFPVKFIIENKADEKYPAVSAASIVAKVTRDSSIPENSGSGYPGDPETINWLKKNLKRCIGFPSFIRHSWKTVMALLGEKKDMKLKNTLNGFYTGPS